MGIDKIILGLRTERELSQKQVADAVGISQSTIAKIEIGRNEATASTIRKLANFFNVSADYLLGRTDEFGGVMISPTGPVLTDDETQLLALFAKMSHPMKIRALAYCEGLLSSDPKRASKA